MKSEREQLTELIESFKRLTASLKNQVLAPYNHEVAAQNLRQAAFDHQLQVEIDGASAAAAEFANQCNALGKRMRTAGSCRPSLITRATDAEQETDWADVVNARGRALRERR